MIKKRPTDTDVMLCMAKAFGTKLDKASGQSLGSRPSLLDWRPSLVGN